MREPIHLSLRQGLALLEQGRLDDARAVFRAILRQDKRQFDAQYFLGAIAMQTGEFEAAKAHFAHAARIDPRALGALIGRADALFALGRFVAALRGYDAALALAGHLDELHTKRANTLLALGRPDDALAGFDRAIALNPNAALAYYNRGNTLLELKRYAEAAESFDQAIARAPGDADAHYNRGIALLELKQHDMARAAFDSAIALRPGHAESHYNRALTLQASRQFADALVSLEQAIGLSPDYAEAHSQRGVSLNALGRLDAALASHDHAIALKPSAPGAYARRGATLHDLNRLDDAIADYNHCIRLQPDSPDAWHGRGVIRLLRGDFAGLADYEHRMTQHPFAQGREGRMLSPDTTPARGERLLVVGDVGLGDTLQFCRYLHDLAKWDVELLIGLQKPLHALLRGMDIPGAFVDPADPNLVFDRWVSVMSLPFIFSTTAETIPASIPYLAADPQRIEHWRPLVPEAGLRLGVCWQGAVRGEMKTRGFPLGALAEIAAIPDVHLLSLHKGVGEAQLADLPQGMAITNFGAEFDAGADAFLDTAAVIALCDLVITCDTAVAHLAGALGARTWLAVQHVPDWRWMQGRDDSPWYPTMRLFRQSTHDDWTPVFAAMARELRALRKIRSGP